MQRGGFLLPAIDGHAGGSAESIQLYTCYERCCSCSPKSLIGYVTTTTTLSVGCAIKGSRCEVCSISRIPMTGQFATGTGPSTATG
jgi:hypothetical protein